MNLVSSSYGLLSRGWGGGGGGLILTYKMGMYVTPKVKKKGGFFKFVLSKLIELKVDRTVKLCLNS